MQPLLLPVPLLSLLLGLLSLASTLRGSGSMAGMAPPPPPLLPALPPPPLRWRPEHLLLPPIACVPLSDASRLMSASGHVFTVQ